MPLRGNSPSGPRGGPKEKNGRQTGGPSGPPVCGYGGRANRPVPDRGPAVRAPSTGGRRAALPHSGCAAQRAAQRKKQHRFSLPLAGRKRVCAGNPGGVSRTIWIKGFWTVCKSVQNRLSLFKKLRPRLPLRSRGPQLLSKSLAEFAPAGTKKIKLVFGRDMCVDENTSQPASVGFVRSSRTDPARGRMHPTRKSGIDAFSTV